MDKKPPTKKSLRSSTRNQIIDEKFQLPLDHGWKREFVYRSMKHGRKQGDAYYYSPDNRKLRSLKEIQAHLDDLSDDPLTIDCFTFIDKPLGIKDKSKEMVRWAKSANTKISKIDLLNGVSVQHKKVETPSNKMKIDLKNVERSIRKKIKTDKVKAMDISPSTPQAEDRQTIQSTETFKVASFKTDNNEVLHAPYKKIWHAKDISISRMFPISKPTTICRENPVGPKLSEQISTLNVQLKINHVSSKKETSFSSSQSKSLEMGIRNTDNEAYYEISSPDVMNEILLAVKTIIDEKHPAPLPLLPTVKNLVSCSSWKRLPPSPILRIEKDKETLDGFIFEWNMHIDNSVADISKYQIIYCEDGQRSSTDMWTEFHEASSMPLPMTMKINLFERGVKYYFSIGAIDVHSRKGPFCTPEIVYLE